MTFLELKEKWSTIPPEKNGYIELETESSLKLEIGYHENNTKSLAVVGVPEIGDLPSSSAIHAEIFKLKDGNQILEFMLLENQYEDEFLHLAWDLIDVTIDKGHPLAAMIKRYITWQKMLQKNVSGVMSLSAQKGLLGELLFLEGSIKSVGPLVAMNAWVGPEGADQDFVFEDTWTEVKSVSAAAKEIQISSLQQLDQNKAGDLVVYFLEKTTPGENRETLPKTVSQIRSMLAEKPLELDRFNTKLILVGYKSSDESIYSKNFYRLIEDRKYQVTENFPKLTRDGIPSEIVECKYTISLSAIESFRSY